MKTILLIEDENDLRLTLSGVLGRAGYNVIEANSGATGLELARKHLPDLILSDINMPDGDGATLLVTIRNDPALRNKQVVLMTGRPDMVSPRKGMEAGADDFLVKPVGLDTLLNCVATRFRRASISWRVEDQTLAQLRSSIPPHLPHEVFTPLGGIIGLVDILVADEVGFSREELRDIYKDLNQSAMRLQRTLRNYLLILDLQNSSPESLPGSLLARQVEENILAGINEAFRMNKRRDDVSIEINAGPVSVKPGDLSRIVEELVDNACKFSRQGTPIKVIMNANVLTVTDAGRGMTVDEIAGIGAFQQFERKKYEQQGLGLGLVLVKKLTAGGKAELSITSQPGEGTQVRVAFSPGSPDV